MVPTREESIQRRLAKVEEDIQLLELRKQHLLLELQQAKEIQKP